MGSLRSLVCLILLFSASAFSLQSDAARQEDEAVASTTSVRPVPRAVRFSGVVNGSSDQTITLTFAIYTERLGGSPLWTETQNLRLDEQGRYAVLLGAATKGGMPLRLFATGEARWLGVRVAEEGAVEQPRVALVSVPYALAAGDAQLLNGRPATDYQLTRMAAAASGESQAAGSETSGAVSTTANTVNRVAKFTGVDTVGDSTITEVGGKVGIGTSSPVRDLHLRSGAPTIRLEDTNFPNSYWELQQSAFVNDTFGFLRYENGAAVESKSMVISNAGFMGLGTGAPARPLHIKSATPAIRIQDSTLPNSFWELQQSAFVVDTFGFLRYENGVAVPGKSMVISAGGDMGLGTTVPGTKLDVAGIIRSTSGGFKFPDGSVQTAAGQARVTGTCAVNSYVRVINQDGTVTCGVDQTGAGGITYPFDSGGQSTTSAAFKVTQTNSVILANDPTFAFATTSIPAAIVGSANPSAGNTAVGVVGLSNSINSPAIVGWNGATGQVGQSTDAQGVIGQSDAIGGTGVEGNSNATTGTGRGGNFHSESPNGVGIHASNSAQGGLAGQFDGDVTVNGTLRAQTIASTGGSVQVSGGINVTSGGIQVTGNSNINGSLVVSGTLTKPQGSFRIDHPLDPEHKYLFHSFVESPDMMNIYNGMIKLDAKGEAWVTMPEWFEALNMDFRYQLTPIGNPGRHVLYIAKEIRTNRFKIAGGKPLAKVSWQVTGIRHDPYANAHRIRVETDKLEKEQGTYVFPEYYQKPVVAKK